MHAMLLARLPARRLALAASTSAAATTAVAARRLATHPPRKNRHTPPSAPAPPPAGTSSSSTTPTTTTTTTTSSAAEVEAEGRHPVESAPPPSALSLDFSPAEEAADAHTRTGARSSRDSLSSIERRRRIMGRVTLALLALGLVGGAVYAGREWDADELKEAKMTAESAPATRWGRTKMRFTSVFDYFNKPVWTELLPPPVPPYQKPYTLLLSIDDLLVTSTWDRQNGWRTAKRPGVDYFLPYMAQFFEIVVFTSQNSYTAIPVLEKLDPYNFYITYKLFREATRSLDGKIVKDLSYLNRDLSKVIVMDTNPEHVSLQPENSIVLPKWHGDARDRGLVAMIPFLESIAIYKPQDVRPILSAYQGKDIPVEYAKKEAEGKRAFLEEWRKSGRARAGAGGLTLSSLFGGSSEPPLAEPLTYLEAKRREAQQVYLEEQRYLAANRENLDRLLEEDRQAAAAQMSGSLMGMIAGLSGAPPPPPPQDAGKAQEKTTGAGKAAAS